MQLSDTGFVLYAHPFKGVGGRGGILELDIWRQEPVETVVGGRATWRTRAPMGPPVGRRATAACMFWEVLCWTPVPATYLRTQESQVHHCNFAKLC